MTRRAELHRWDALPLEKITEMVSRKVVAGTETTLVQAYVKKGSLSPLHAHDGEQAVYVLQGTLRVRLSGDERLVREGEVLVVPAGLRHQIEAIDDAFVLSCLSARGRHLSLPDAR